MKTRVRCLLAAVPLAVVLSAAHAGAQTITGVPAGILPYACTEHGARYLLAYDPDRARQAWTAFGGRPRGMESAAATARRELREETNCVYDQATVENLRLKGPSRSGEFYLYAAEVPFRSIADIEAPRGCADVERSFWIWVPHADFMEALDSMARRPVVEIGTAPKIRFYLWESGADSFRRALEDGVLERAEPCRPGG